MNQPIHDRWKIGRKRLWRIIRGGRYLTNEERRITLLYRHQRDPQKIGRFGTLGFRIVRNKR